MFWTGPANDFVLVLLTALPIESTGLAVSKAGAG